MASETAAEPAPVALVPVQRRGEVGLDVGAERGFARRFVGLLRRQRRCGIRCRVRLREGLCVQWAAADERRQQHGARTQSNHEWPARGAEGSTWTRILRNPAAGCEALDPIQRLWYQYAGAIGFTHDLAATDQAVQVREALAGGHAEHVHAHRAAEQHAEHVDGALGRARVPRARAPGAARGRRSSALQARVQSAERLVVRGQHQHLITDPCADRRERLEPVAQRIGVRLGGEHRDVGADARQHLVAGDQQPAAAGRTGTGARASARGR